MVLEEGEGFPAGAESGPQASISLRLHARISVGTASRNDDEWAAGRMVTSDDEIPAWKNRQAHAGGAQARAWVKRLEPGDVGDGALGGAGDGALEWAARRYPRLSTVEPASARAGLQARTGNRNRSGVRGLFWLCF